MSFHIRSFKEQIHKRYFRKDTSLKCVAINEGEQLSKRIGARSYVENSALTTEGVRHVRLQN